MEDQELFDVISSTLKDKGFINKWKSELMLLAVQPLYETRVLPCVRLENDPEGKNHLKLQLLLDLFGKLGLENTKQMLKSEVDTRNVNAQMNIEEYMEKSTVSEEEPFLNALWRISGPAYLNDVAAEVPEVPTEDDGRSETDCDEDLFETAISKLQVELEEASINEDGDGERSLRTSLDR